MTLKKQKNLSDNISIVEIIQIFWKERILIIIVSLSLFIFFGLLQNFVNGTKNNYVITMVKLKDHENLILYYQNFVPSSGYNISLNRLKTNYDYNLSINYFFEQNKNKFIDFNNFFEKSNISAKDYFSENLKTKNLVYSLKHSDQLNADFLLKEYSIFLHNQYQIELKYRIKEILLNQIYFLEKNKSFLNNIDLEKFKKKINEQEFSNFNDRTVFSFNLNSLDGQILFFKDLIISLDKGIFDYQLPDDYSLETKKTVLKKINSIKIAFTGLLFGFFLSLIIVFFKNLIRNKL